MRRAPAERLHDDRARLSWRLILFAAAVCILRLVLVAVDLPVTQRELTWGVILDDFGSESLVMIVLILPSALMAERLVTRRGTSRFWTYFAATCIGALGTGAFCVLQGFVQTLLEGQSFPPRAVLSVGTYAALDGLVWGGLACFLLSNHWRLEARTRELRALQERHAVHQRELADSGLRALRARVDPEQLIDSLTAIRRQYDAAPAEGEAALEALVIRLRHATAQASP